MSHGDVLWLGVIEATALKADFEPPIDCLKRRRLPGVEGGGGKFGFKEKCWTYSQLARGHFSVLA